MEIKVYATLRPIVGAPSVHLNGASEMTVAQMLAALYEKFPDLKPELHKGREDLHPAIHILINGRDMRYIDGQQTRLSPGDEVRIFPPVGGGRR
ncbi:MAG: MoaD/ThiS family protein [Chloroflexi bacterium]|nr:MAG: MoaD/ThiS family protein [Chloroflexota bacterium]